MPFSVNDKALQKKLVGYRRELHKNPELSLKEFETTKFVRKWLEEEDIKILDLPLDLGAVAEISGDQPGPTIAIRADMDALPIKEETGLEFSSLNPGIMHACGHDFHTSAVLGAAILLKQHSDKIRGKVRFVFQPGEEVTTGADYILNSGALDCVDAIFGFHNKPDLPVGTIGIKPGPLMAAVDRFEIDINGAGGHAGIPESTIDSIVTASQLVTAFQSIVSRNLSPFKNSVISVTRFQSGNTWNVIPDKAELEGTVRSFQEESRELVRNLMKRTCEGIASAYGARTDFRWYPMLPGVFNDSRFTGILEETAKELGYTAVEAEPVPGGEDFAVYQKKIPGYFVWVGVGGTHGWHHPAYNLNEDALIIAANYFANLVIKAGSKWDRI